jgi:hypothetical protein
MSFVLGYIIGSSSTETTPPQTTDNNPDEAGLAFLILLGLGIWTTVFYVKGMDEKRDWKLCILLPWSIFVLRFVIWDYIAERKKKKKMPILPMTHQT